VSKDVITVLAFVSSGVKSPFAIFAGLDVELRGRSLERASMTREDTFGECRHLSLGHCGNGSQRRAHFDRPMSVAIPHLQEGCLSS
jgi:hypothetical protein